MLVERHSHIKYILPIIFLSVIVIVLLATAMGMTSLLTETRKHTDFYAKRTIQCAE